VSQLRRALHVVRRLAVVAVVAAFVVVVGLQYARIIQRNLAMAGELASAQRDVATLQARRTDQDWQIRRLSDPVGAIPEIHDRLHLVGDHEAIIYLKRHDAGP
jgi:cell division protein FtsB